MLSFNIIVAFSVMSISLFITAIKAFLLANDFFVLMLPFSYIIIFSIHAYMKACLF